MKRHASTLASPMPMSGKIFARPLSHNAPHANAKMLVAEIVNVVRSIRALVLPNVPERMTMMPTIALKPTETIRNQSATRLGFIEDLIADLARHFRALQNVRD